jgi:hypothetical protein
MAWVWATWEIVLALLGVLGLGIGIAWARFGAGIKGKERGAITAVIGFIVVLIAVGGAALIPANIAPGPGPAPPATSLSSYVSTSAVAGVAPALPGACTNYPTASIPSVTCTIGFNKTQTGFQLALSNTTDLGYTPGGAGTTYASLNYIDLALHSARTDTINQTYLFTYTYTALPTWTSVGSSTTSTCSAVGFTSTTSSSPGAWKVTWAKGQNAGITPTQSAPTVNTGVGADPTAIAYTGSITQVAQVSFAGGNSTSTSFNCWQGLSLYEQLTIGISIGQSSPPLFDLNLLPIGYNT